MPAKNYLTFQTNLKKGVADSPQLKPNSLLEILPFSVSLSNKQLGFSNILGLEIIISTKVIEFYDHIWNKFK